MQRTEGYGPPGAGTLEAVVCRLERALDLVAQLEVHFSKGGSDDRLTRGPAPLREPGDGARSLPAPRAPDPEHCPRDEQAAVARAPRRARARPSADGQYR